MKNASLLLVALVLFWGRLEASAQMISLGAAPGSQTVTPASEFSVSLTLNVPQDSGPTNVVGFDLFLVTAAINSGYFSITAVTPTGPFTDPAGPSTLPDSLTTAAASGFVRNQYDQGFTGTSQTVPVANLSLEDLVVSVAANTPLGTYMFKTSTISTAGAAAYSDVVDSNGNAYEATSPGTFSITVVPEPGAAALLLAGAILVGGAGLRRRMRTSARRNPAEPRTCQRPDL